MLDDEVEVPAPMPSAAEEPALARLRRWSQENKYRVAPNLLEIFFVHLLDQGMIQCEDRGGGRVVFVARGAKEEVRRFITNPEFAGYFDRETVGQLMRFAYRKRYVELVPRRDAGSWISDWFHCRLTNVTPPELGGAAVRASSPNTFFEKRLVTRIAPGDALYFACRLELGCEPLARCGDEVPRKLVIPGNGDQLTCRHA